MDTPFLDKIQQLARLRARFFMPGHKGNPAAMPAFGQVLPYDITEIEGADDLSHPSAELAESEANMSRIYGSGATLYSASGSSSSICAMLALFVGEGGQVIMQRGCHVSAIRALAFLDATPHWLLPQEGRLTPTLVQAALQNTGAKAVYITSPNYYGQMPDIAALAAVCHQHGAVLLVDNAHGAHLRFLQPNRHPISLGADACADSAHKTLPCLTPAAMLHLADNQLAEEARSALNLFSSTSPSYLVLQSLDWAAGLLQSTPPDFEGTTARLAKVANTAAHLLQYSDDPLRLCLRPALGGWEAEEINRALIAAGIHPELADSHYIVLMASPYNTDEDFALLAKTLAPFTLRAPLKTQPFNLFLPPMRCPLRKALFAHKKEVLPVAQSIGHIAADLFAPCPPGVPVVLPGEEITPAVAAALLAGGISHINVLK